MMSRPLFILFLTVASWWSGLAFAAGAAQVPASSMSTSRGAFSVHLGYGHEQVKVLNADGNEGRFTGWGRQLGIDMRIGGGGPGEFRLSVLGKMAETKNSSDKTQELSSQNFAAGIKVFTTNTLYFGGGMGVTHQDLETSEKEISVTNQYYLATAGFEFKMFGSVYLHLNGFANVNPIKRTEPMTTHSFSQGLGAYLMLTYSPPDTSITTIYGR
jgi:hypothetical protein